MGSVSRVFKKVTRAVKKPVSKAFKSVAKGIMKVGKATMRGVAKLNKKLGPLGSIALAIAMPYALGGLSTATTAAMNSTNTFIKAIGTVGNQIRTGYQAFNAGVGNAFSTITKSISQGFRKFAPKGVQNMFSQISTGAKNLFNSAKAMTKKYSPIKGKQGTVDVLGLQPNIHGEGLIQTTVKSADAKKMLESGLIKPNQIQDQFLGSKKLFVQGSTEADKFITETINDAYKKTTSTYGKNASRYFNDLKTKAQDLGTYVNDAEIGNVVNQYATPDNIKAGMTSVSGTADMDLMYDVDLLKTGDYVENVQGGYVFDGSKTYGKIPESKTVANKVVDAAKKSVMSKAKSLLKPSDSSEKIEPYYMAQKDMTMDTTLGSYTGTDIQGSGGGSLLEGVFSDAERNRIMNYYKNMNLIGSS